MIYTYKDIFSSEHKGEQFYMEFQSDTGKHWFYGIVGEPEQYFYLSYDEVIFYIMNFFIPRLVN